MLVIPVAAISTGVLVAGGEPTWCNTKVAPAPPDLPIEWRFAFVDDDLDRLELVRRDLEARGLKFRDIGQGPCFPCDEVQLNMVTVAHHSPDSFREFERGLCDVATRRRLMMYWGALPTDRAYWPRRPARSPAP